MPGRGPYYYFSQDIKRAKVIFLLLSSPFSTSLFSLSLSFNTTVKLFLLTLSLVYYRSIFPDILAYVQPIDDLILSEENVQVSITIVYIIHYYTITAVAYK